MGKAALEGIEVCMGCEVKLLLNGVDGYLRRSGKKDCEKQDQN